jgi:hypothetical protein
MPAVRDVLAGGLVGASVAGGGLALTPGGEAPSPAVIERSAYVLAARSASCGQVDWRDLAAIRSIESPASIGTEQPNGDVPGVQGPELDGSGVGGNTGAFILDDGSYERAQGPMQFIWTSWDLFGRDASGDGRADPHNLYDAAAAAAAHLCSSLDRGASKWEAFRDYNGSGPAAARYADTATSRAAAMDPDPGQTVAPTATKAATAPPCTVGTTPQGTPAVGDVASCTAQRALDGGLSLWDRVGGIVQADGTPVLVGAYATLDGRLRVILGGGAPPPASGGDSRPGASGAPAGTIVDVRGIQVDASIAGQLARMIDAAALDGITLTGSGWRSAEDTAYLRVRNGCPDVHTSPAESCAVPTAIPGTSMHERGLAIDFHNAKTADLPVARWLANNAHRFGLHNLPSEPWHYSTNGR